MNRPGGEPEGFPRACGVDGTPGGRAFGFDTDADPHWLPPPHASSRTPWHDATPVPAPGAEGRKGYFLPASLVGLAGYAAVGLWNAVLTRYFLLSLPALAVAILLGRAVNQRMSGHGFFRFVYIGLIAVGSVLLAQTTFR